jgi:HD-GYP domain-containing protein (c-di-GMP phosphodiesterase class II)
MRHRGVPILALAAFAAIVSAALLHFVGREKVFREVKRHVESGAALLHELDGFSPTVHQLVRSHHERLDGSGYPDGARSDELSLDVRILAVCAALSLR